MLAMMPRLLAHRPTVAISLSRIASSCARVKKYVASLMPPPSSAMAPQTLSARTSSGRSRSIRARNCATMAHCWPTSSRPSRLCVSVPPRPAQHHDKIPGRLGEELGAPEEFRSFDHLAQRPLGGRHLALGQEQRRPDSQILGLCRGVGQTTADRPHLIQVATRRLQLATAQADLCPPPERERQQRAIPDRFRLAGGLGGLCQRAVERPLLPIGDPQVVVALGDALPYPSPVEGAEGDLPGPDRLGVPPPQVTDDPQVVAAASRRGKIAVPARDHEGLREVVRRLIDPSADQGDGAPRIESVTLDRPLVPPTRFIQRQIEPPQSLIVAPQPRLRGPVDRKSTRLN